MRESQNHRIALDLDALALGLILNEKPQDFHPTRDAGVGVLVAFGDGSVRFVRDSINLGTWQSLASINGGEFVSTDF